MLATRFRSSERWRSAYLAEGLKALLLGVRVDVGSDNEPDNVEEGHPGVLGKELLGKGQRDGRGDPADLHDGHETGPHGCADLVEGARARDHRHTAQVHGILNGRDLRRVSISAEY